MRLLVDISAHGLGHLAQTAPVLNALARRAPKLQVTVRSTLSRAQLARRIDGEFAHLPEARDFGFVMRNAVDIDLAASATKYREFHADWGRRVANEAAWLRQERVDAVLSNVAYLPLVAAAEAGIPAVGFSSLNWADLFAHYFGAEAWAGEIHARMLAAYNAATCFLRVTPGLPMTGLARLHDIAPIAHVGRCDRARVAMLLQIEPYQRWVLLAMGGMEFRLPIESWPRVPGVIWLVPEAWRVEREDVRNFDALDLHFSDLLASVDAVVTKPGYGTFVEAACGGVPILYLERPDWPETPHLAEWLTVHGRAQALSRQQLLAGGFIDFLQSLWDTPAPRRPQPDGAEAAAEWLLKSLDLA